jgi:hypothetical protein
VCATVERHVAWVASTLLARSGSPGSNRAKDYLARSQEDRPSLAGIHHPVALQFSFQREGERSI